MASLNCVTSNSADLSLLHFLQDRLREDIDLVLSHTPMLGVQVNNSEFEDRFLDRAGLLSRVRTELAIVGFTVESMQAEQGPPPIGLSTFEGGPATDLGSEVLKLLAARYGEHPDYRAEWRPQVQLPRL
jgi:hypothetical protein